MRDGLAGYGPVREGVRAITGYEGVEAQRCPSRLGQARDVSLVFAGVCSHAPGHHRPGRAGRPCGRDGLYAAFDGMRERPEPTRPGALVVIAAEHFVNFLMDNMPSFTDGHGGFIRGPDRGPGVAGHREAWARPS